MHMTFRPSECLAGGLKLVSVLERRLAAQLSVLLGFSGLASFYFKNRPNLGDRYSSPTLYFPQLKETVSLDPFSARLPKVWLQKTVLVGGGGLIAHPTFQLNMELLAAYRPRVLVAWGVGHNAHGAREISYPDYLERFDLVGIRDYGSKYDWVPCASCLHPGFDRKYEVTEEFVVYENVLCSPLHIAGFKKLHNAEDSLEKVLAFLGSANTVLTSSYHGAYWATLLGRNVIIVNPFSSKFFGFKHTHPIADESNWRSKEHEVRSYPEALEECRMANLKFAEKVLSLIG
jgi:hypothetical protein